MREEDEPRRVRTDRGDQQLRAHHPEHRADEILLIEGGRLGVQLGEPVTLARAALERSIDELIATTCTLAVLAARRCGAHL